MANEYYITAATPPNDTAEANTANAYYISAGTIPDDIVAAGAWPRNPLGHPLVGALGGPI